MKQFYVFILNAAGIAIFELVDSSFGNNLGIDSICVLSAFTIITWCVGIFCSIGKYAYEIKMGSLSECLLLQVASSVIMTLILLLTYKKLPYIYHLTERQYQLLSKCLFWYAVPLIIHFFAEFLDTYLLLKCKNKLIIAGNIFHYTIMIVLDAVVLWLHGECYHLVITTGITWVMYFLFLCIFGDFTPELKKPDPKVIKECLVIIGDKMVDKIMGKVATVAFNILASHLGTELYALHSIGYTIATTSANITNVWYQYQVVCLHGIENIKEKYKRYKAVRRKTALPAVLACYVLLFILIGFMHGELALEKAFLMACLYETQCIFLVVNKNADGFLASVGYTKIIRYGGLVGALVRVPVALISCYTPIGIYGFALAAGIDYLFRGFYYSLGVRHYMQTEGRV